MPGGTSTTIVEVMIARFRNSSKFQFRALAALVISDIALHVWELLCR